MGNSESLRKRRRAEVTVSMGRVTGPGSTLLTPAITPRPSAKYPALRNCINLSRWAGHLQMDDSFCAFSASKNPFAMCLLLSVQNASAPGRPCVFHPLSVITSKWLHRPGNGASRGNVVRRKELPTGLTNAFLVPQRDWPGRIWQQRVVKFMSLLCKGCSGLQGVSGKAGSAVSKARLRKSRASSCRWRKGAWASLQPSLACDYPAPPPPPCLRWGFSSRLEQHRSFCHELRSFLSQCLSVMPT